MKVINLIILIISSFYFISCSNNPTEAEVADVPIKTYSMALRASAFKEFVGSSEARIKKSFEEAGIAHAESGTHFRSQASKALIMFLTE